ncbi:MAG: glutathione peroxidase [Brumimicrobium sp.]
MKNILMLGGILMALMANGQTETIYDYEVETIEGETISLSKFKGKKMLIVNTASKCGFTPQYKQLEELYQMFKDKDFVILGFPSNDFLSQEPGTNEEIAEFCQKNYGVTFPMMAKIKVKGKNKAPLYNYLTSKELNGHSDSKVKWNFQKYLIGKDGKIEGMHYSKVIPTDPEIVNWVIGE